MYQLVEVNDRKTRKKFVEMQWDIYEGDKHWVPPLKMDTYKLLKGDTNPLLKNGPSKLFIAVDEAGKTVGRIMAGVDLELLKEKTYKRGYLSMFECIDDEKAANLLFDAAVAFVNQFHMDEIYGPVSPSNGEDGRGILVEGFEEEPALMNTYTPEYYVRLFENYGFLKAEDEFGYQMSHQYFPVEKYRRVVEFSMRKFDFRVDKVNMKNIEGEAADLLRIITTSREDAWDYFKTPTLDEVMDEFQNIKMFVDPDYVYFARRNSDNRPIGFVLALPDYNVILKKLNGRLVTPALIYFLFKNKVIKRLRLFAQYVVPEYEGRGVNGALYYNVATSAIRKGILTGDASTISELNKRSLRSVEDAGGKLYKVIRYYKKDLKSGPSESLEVAGGA